jgi:hypothetical protein
MVVSICVISTLELGKQMVRQQHRHSELIQSAEDMWKLFQQISTTTVVVLEKIPDHRLPSHFFTPFTKEESHNIFEFLYCTQWNCTL